METMNAPIEELEVKAADGNLGLVSGYAAVFRERDSGSRHDRIMPGAFKKSLQERGKEVIYLPSHDYDVHIGQIPAVPVRVEEDTKGLFTETKFFLDTQAGKDTFTVISEYQKAGRPIGMSFTFKPVEFEIKAEGRDLLAVDLFEYGHTAIPMHRKARTTDVKAYYGYEERADLAKQGYAMPDGSFPIVTAYDLYRAIYDYQCGMKMEGAQEHILARAEALGYTDAVPRGMGGRSRKSVNELLDLTIEDWEQELGRRPDEVAVTQVKAALSAMLKEEGTPSNDLDYYRLRGRALDLIG